MPRTDGGSGEALHEHRGSPSSDPSLTPVLLAFGAIYFIWGSTYLAIRFAIETMPPLAMAAVRFLAAGGMLFAWASARGAARPTSRQWRDAAVSGSLLLAGGNGAVVVAQQWVPSGLAALLVATVPLWLVLLDWAFGSGARPTPRMAGGLIGGCVGIGLLAGAPGLGAGGVEELFGALLLLIASLSWASGSLRSRYATDPPRPRMLVAMQMLCGGAVLGLMAAGFGEWSSLDPGAISVKSWAALVYLILAGALIGYAAYIWLLTFVPPARVGTYAYVNPVVAMFLGWALADEPLTFRSLVAAAIILGSVIAINTEAGGPRRASDPVAAIRTPTR